MAQPNDLSRSLVALDQDSTIIVVVEMSQSSWLVAGMLPGIERQPRKKLEPSAERLLGLLHRWRDEAVKAGRKITRIALAFEAGRDGFWLARWLRAHGVEGACDPSLECRRIARTSPGQDRPARHRVAEAGVLGVARGEVDRLSELAGELISLRTDILVAWNTPAAHAARRAAVDIPIVIIAGDPVG